MGQKCLKQFIDYHECFLPLNIVTLKPFLNFPNLCLKYHLPTLQSQVCPPPRKKLGPNSLVKIGSFIHRLFLCRPLREARRDIKRGGGIV